MPRFRLKLGDCLEVMKDIPDNSFHSVVTDPPYGLKFMGKNWDHGVPGKIFWEEILRVAKPGAHLLAFGGSRTHHRLMVAIEDAGWEIRDCLMWLYGCLSEDTEILVDGRWEPYHKAIKGKHALCYNVDNDTFEWQEIQELFVYDYQDTAYRIQSDYTDQIVSRNHRCIVERDGRKVFRYAETLQQQESIPVLEDLPGLLAALPLPNKRTGKSKQDLFERVFEKEIISRKNRDFSWEKKRKMGSLCRLWEQNMERDFSFEKNTADNLFLSMQRETPWSRMEKTCSQGQGRMDGEISSVLSGEDVGRKQSCLEGRSNLLQEKGQLQANQVCTLSSRISRDGTQRRLCNGTSPDDSASNRSMSRQKRSSASQKSRSTRQSTGKFSTVCQQSRSQTVRASRFSRSDLATVTSIFYEGKVWCVRVPSGAFVARRNGKIFITGNSGFPKSHDISKAIDKTAGAEREVVGIKPGHEEFAGRTTKEHIDFKSGTEGFDRPWMHDDEARERYHQLTAPATPEAQQWFGWGTALKPAVENIVLARKPLSEKTVAENVLEHGVGGLNIDGCRIGTEQTVTRVSGGKGFGGNFRDDNWQPPSESYASVNNGRWPANLMLDEEAAEMLDEQTGTLKSGKMKQKIEGGQFNVWGKQYPREVETIGDSGGASRFFYTSKASKKDRGEGNNHPTCKPTALMSYLCRLVTPPNGIVLDPFCGSGSTGVAALREGFRFYGIEKESEYFEIARKRIENVQKNSA